MPNILNSKKSSSVEFTVDKGLVFENNKLSLVPPTLLFDYNTDKKLKEDPRKYNFLVISIFLRGAINKTETFIFVPQKTSPNLLRLNDLSLAIWTRGGDKTELTNITLSGLTSTGSSNRTPWTLTSVYGLL